MEMQGAEWTETNLRVISTVLSKMIMVHIYRHNQYLLLSCFDIVDDNYMGMRRKQIKILSGIALEKGITLLAVGFCGGLGISE